MWASPIALQIVPYESDCQIAAAANLFEGAKANKAKWEMISRDSVSPFVEAGAPAPRGCIYKIM